ncbi:trimethylamine methyltransferase family protein [Sporomusa sp.]|uniref:trimethylamine methyltransferase family protein n=1 Tax=Sporomusa sp. TaxID=2078658 RepID=UPI002C73E65D|nr:trimethylamine methyltransferase family protein [Sporomusa sp.]HWR42706.1 trimethylamine methyltransferase family protein [Sporomusa sp.]
MNKIKTNSVTKQSVQFKVLNEGQCGEIVHAAFRVLERTGCNVHHEGARKILQEGGCRVDGIRVYIPTYLLEKAIRTAPSQITIYDREGNPALHLGANNGNSYFGTGFENQYLIDINTGEKRLTTKQDVAKAGLVIDALPNIDLATGLACISDCTSMLADVYETRILLEHTTKPHWLWNFTRDNIKAQVEMCAAVAGGMDKFLAKPFVIAGAGASTPLAHAEDTLDKLLYMFEIGIPTPYVVATILGGTAPVTLAGSFVMGLADTLVGLLLSQLTNEGCPFMATCWTDMFDMRTMAFSHTGPEFSLGQAATADIFRYLDLPFVVHLGTTDSPIFDQQAAFDIGVQIYTGIVSGSNVNTFLGYLETAMSSSLEALVLGDETIGYIRRIVEGIEVSFETLAEEAIHNVGPSGNFLGEEHTMKHFRKRWTPTNFIRTSYEKWAADGKKDFKARANEKVKEIIAQGARKPLPPEVLAKLDAIVAKAEEKYK